MTKKISTLFFIISAMIIMATSAFAANEAAFNQTLEVAIANAETVIDLDGCDVTVDEIGTLFSNFADDHAEFYYLDTKFAYSYNNNNVVTKLSVNYTMSADEIATANAAFTAEVDTILSLVNDTMTDAEKVMAVHDYFIANYSYDLTYQGRSAYDLFVNKTGVCQAYSIGFKYIMGQLNIPCTIVVSKEMNHGWNKVLIDGEWFHVDVTFDDPIVDGQNNNTTPYYTYFLVTDAEISADHYAWN